MQETRNGFLGWEDPPEKGMATHSSILAWRISWTEEPGGPMGLQRVRHKWATNTFFSVHSPHASDLHAQGSVIRFVIIWLCHQILFKKWLSGLQCTLTKPTELQKLRMLGSHVLGFLVYLLWLVWVSGFFKTSLFHEYPRLRVTVLKTIITNSSCNKSQHQKSHFSPFLADKVS